MKNNEPEEVPVASIERNPWLLAASFLTSAVFIFWGYLLLKDVNPAGMLVMIPGGIFGFQSLWFLLHPFALIYADKVEIRQSFLHHRTRYFVDMKETHLAEKGGIYITYNDDEIERLNLFGIRESQKNFLDSHFKAQITSSLQKRA